MDRREYEHAMRQAEQIERDLRAMGRRRWHPDQIAPPPRPPQAPARQLAIAALVLALVSCVFPPLGFSAIWLTWKATRQGMQLTWPERAYAIGGASLGLLTATLTVGLIVGAIVAALR